MAEDNIGGLVLVSFAEEDALGGDDGDDAGGRSAGRGRFEDTRAGTAGVVHAAAGGRGKRGRGEDGGQGLGGVWDERHGV